MWRKVNIVPTHFQKETRVDQNKIYEFFRYICTLKTDVALIFCGLDFNVTNGKEMIKKEKETPYIYCEYISKYFNLAINLRHYNCLIAGYLKPKQPLIQMSRIMTKRLMLLSIPNLLNCPINFSMRRHSLKLHSK